MAKAVTPKKMCINCGKTKPISDFYPNRAWGAQQNCDLYCKKCVAAMVFDKDSLRKYMWENNRLFSEKIYRVENPDGIEPASEKARTILRYAGTAIPAATLLDDGKHRAIAFGFPLETLTTEGALDLVLRISMQYLVK
jgi:hypothetical protein